MESLLKMIYGMTEILFTLWLITILMLNVQFFVHVWSMKFDISDEKTSKNKSGNVSVWDSVNSGGLQNFIPLIRHGGIL